MTEPLIELLPIAAHPRTSELASVLDAAPVESMMHDFYRLTNIPTAIVDLNGTVIAGAGWQRVCVQFHRASPETCRNCIESDTLLTTGVPEGKFRVYKCKNNMWDVSTPLMVAGRHVGNVFSGQFFFEHEPVDEELFREQARRYGFDERDYLKALKEAPRLSREKVRLGMGYLAKSARLLSLLSYRNSELALAVAQREALALDLQRSQQRLKHAQNIAQLGSWELDLVRNTLSWSDEVYAIFGLEPQVFGATYEAFLNAVHPDDRAAVDAAYSGSVRDGKDSYEITHRIVRKPSGEVRWVHEKCEHYRADDGQIVRSVGMVQDITERHHAEEQLRHKQKLESIGLLAAGVAHDFNNLLVGVLGNASLAQDMLEPAHPVTELLDGILAASRRAADLTRQMLAYAGKGRFVIEAFDLSALVQEMSALVCGSVPSKVRLDLQLESDLPLIEGDRGQLQQVVMNLLINAAEAIGDQPGSITVRTRLVEAGGWPGQHDHFTGRSICLEVSDTGCGMDGVTQAKIFDPFFTTKFDGRGLGLAGVAGILRSHNAPIQVESAPGQGARFTILFPALDGKKPEPASGNAGPSAGTATGTVLIVDDEEIVRTFAQRALEKEGYQVLTAANGQDAIMRAKEHTGRIEGLLLDSSMPGMSGEDTLPELLRLRPGMKVIISSGYDRDETLVRFQGQSVTDFIQKPYPLDVLREKIRAVFDAGDNKRTRL